MTGVGMCGVFIPDRFRQAGRGANGKVSDRLGVGKFKRGERYIGRVRVGSLYSFGGRLFSLRLCSSGFQDLLRLNPISSYTYLLVKLTYLL
jgi:hypothetical protein